MAYSEMATETERSTRWWLCLVVPLLLSLIPFRAALQNGSVAGAGPDVVTTLWTMAWYRKIGRVQLGADFPIGLIFHLGATEPSCLR